MHPLINSAGRCEASRQSAEKVVKDEFVVQPVCMYVCMCMYLGVCECMYLGLYMYGVWEM